MYIVQVWSPVLVEDHVQVCWAAALIASQCGRCSASATSFASGRCMSPVSPLWPVALLGAGCSQRGS